MLNEVNEIPIREVELYENERYNPISGWSHKGLLPSDRSRFSTSDGSSSWSDINAANDAFLSIGWTWDTRSPSPLSFEGGNSPYPGWRVMLQITGERSDAKTVKDIGFEYATDFTSVNESWSPKKGLSSFVRRRRIIRNQIYDAEIDIPETLSSSFTCHYCDLEKLEDISDLLLESLSIVSIYKLGRQLPNITKLNPIKTTLVQLFSLYSNDNLFNINDIENMVEKFSKSHKDMWNSSWAADDLNDEIEKRKVYLNTTFFKYDERIALAKAIIHKYDTNYFFHCRIRHCNEQSCEFQHVQCINIGCPSVVSKCWSSKHDTICPYKIVNCTRNCGDTVCRKDMYNHLTYACILRAVHCPFADLGCMATLTHQDVEKHLNDCIQSHLLLSLNRIKEQQDVIVTLHQKTKEYDKLASDFIALGATVTAVSTLVNEVDKKHTKIMTEELKKNDTKSSKEINLAIGEFRTENSKVRNELNGIKSEQSQLKSGLINVTKDVNDMKKVLPKPPSR